MRSNHGRRICLAFGTVVIGVCLAWQWLVPEGASTATSNDPSCGVQALWDLCGLLGMEVGLEEVDKVAGHPDTMSLQDVSAAGESLGLLLAPVKGDLAAVLDRYPLAIVFLDAPSLGRHGHLILVRDLGGGRVVVMDGGRSRLARTQDVAGAYGGLALGCRGVAAKGGPGGSDASLASAQVGEQRLQEALDGHRLANDRAVLLLGDAADLVVRLAPERLEGAEPDELVRGLGCIYDGCYSSSPALDALASPLSVLLAVRFHGTLRPATVSFDPTKRRSDSITSFMDLLTDAELITLFRDQQAFVPGETSESSVLLGDARAAWVLLGDDAIGDSQISVEWHPWSDLVTVKVARYLEFCSMSDFEDSAVPAPDISGDEILTHGSRGDLGRMLKDDQVEGAYDGIALNSSIAAMPLVTCGSASSVTMSEAWRAVAETCGLLAVATPSGTWLYPSLYRPVSPARYTGSIDEPGIVVSDVGLVAPILEPAARARLDTLGMDTPLGGSIEFECANRTTIAFGLIIP